jgi:hypothetical protein
MDGSRQAKAFWDEANSHYHRIVLSRFHNFVARGVSVHYSRLGKPRYSSADQLRRRSDFIVGVRRFAFETARGFLKWK